MEIENQIDDFENGSGNGTLCEKCGEEEGFCRCDECFPERKPILDACCGSRAFWFSKNNNKALFVDERQETIIRKDSVRKNGKKWNGWTFQVNPDVIADFAALPFDDNCFALVVFDPPHMTSLNDNAYMAKQYGRLKGDWRGTIQHGFSECFRVLCPFGTLIFKWNECEVPVRDILKLTPMEPLFGHKSGRQSKTHWIVFMKTEESTPIVDKMVG